MLYELMYCGDETDKESVVVKQNLKKKEIKSELFYIAIEHYEKNLDFIVFDKLTKGKKLHSLLENPEKFKTEWEGCSPEEMQEWVTFLNHCTIRTMPEIVPWKHIF